MKNCLRKGLLVGSIALGFILEPQVIQAQSFVPPGNGDLLGGFRKSGTHQGSNDIVVFLANVTNLISLPVGNTMTLGNINAARLTDAFSSDFTFIQWSVFGANYNQSGVWSTGLGNFPQSTLWYTVPRTNVSVQSATPVRYTTVSQGEVGQDMLSIGAGAQVISGQLSGGTNADNNTILVREPFQAQYSQNYLDTFMGDQFNGQGASFGDLTGNVFNFSVENVVPSPFSSSVRSDLYEAAPAASTGRNPATYPDPITGSTTSVYYVGHFDLSPSGVLTFTRDVATPPAPPAPTLTTTLSGSTVKISFPTTNGATYSLIFTNISGLSTARSNWPTLGSPIIGNGGITNFTDTATTPGRVYSVTAH
jgi:hypothetical protein